MDPLDFYFYDPDGSVARDDLEAEFIEFLLLARVPQRVRFLVFALYTTIDLGLSSFPSAGLARLQTQVATLTSHLVNFLWPPSDGDVDAPMVLGPQALPTLLRPWSHYVRLFDNGPVLHEASQNTFAEIMLTYTPSDRFEVLTRALAVTLDLANTWMPYDLECSQVFVHLSLPTFFDNLSTLELANAPPSPILTTGNPFGPLTVVESEATTPPMPSPSNPLPSPRAAPRCRRIAGHRRCALWHLPAPPLLLRPPGLPVFFTRGKRGSHAPLPPLFHASSQALSALLWPRPPKPKEPP